MKKKLIIEIIAALLVLVFLYACGSKWIDFRMYINETNNQPFPNALTPWLVWIIPVAEFGIAVCLAFGRTRLIAFSASLILFLAFTIYTMAVLLHAFAYVPCSCGGIVRMHTWPQQLVFNLFFAAVSLLGVLLSRRPGRVG